MMMVVVMVMMATTGGNYDSTLPVIAVVVMVVVSVLSDPHFSGTRFIYSFQRGRCIRVSDLANPRRIEHSTLSSGRLRLLLERHRA
jgi:hypothetical protein